MFFTLVLRLFYFDDFFLELELVEVLPAGFGVALVAGFALGAEVFFTAVVAFGFAGAFAFGFNSALLSFRALKAAAVSSCSFSNSS